MSEPKTAGGPCKAPPITFATFVLSLAQAVMDQLGQAERDAANAEEHLLLAKQSIDLLEMLECKTAGNLDEEEAKLHSTLLYEVRMGYLAATKGT
jgi:hypothetical protein